jgi:transcriptional regulator with XRE-family HTH domain
MNAISQVSAEIRSALQMSGLRQADLREAAGVSRQTLANVLSGSEDYKLSTLLALADKLGLELLLLPKGAVRGLQASPTAPVVASVVDRARGRLAALKPGSAS